MTVFIGGLGCIAGGLIYFRDFSVLQDRLHAVYVRLLIFPELEETPG